jgi:hypothetical protein
MCCRGSYELQPKAFYSKADPIFGPVIHVQLQPNLMKPTSLSVEYDKKANFIVGEKLPGKSRVRKELLFKSKPISLSVEYDKKANFVVGEKLPGKSRVRKESLLSIECRRISATSDSRHGFIQYKWRSRSCDFDKVVSIF